MTPGKILFPLFCITLISASVTLGQALTSSNLPIIVIQTSGGFIPDEPKVNAHMGIIDNGEGLRNNLTDDFNGYDGNIGIERRGSSSLWFPKSQYGLELRGKTGEDSTASLLGMPSEEDWILFAPYNDKSLMRDVLAYKIARDMGRYATRTRYCELILDGQYEGIYVLEEKIKRDKNRVDISNLQPDETSGEDLTGGYILKIDKFTGSVGSGFSSPHRPKNASGNQVVYFQYEYPDPFEIVHAQRTYIEQYIKDFESTLKSNRFDHPEQGYPAYIDVGSFVDYLIVNEVSKNVDAYRISTFFHKDKNSEGGKLKMGPVWDFNLGFGNANYCTGGSPYGFAYQFNSLCPTDEWLVPFWWERLLEDARFSRAVGERWIELRSGPLETTKIHAYIDSVADVLNQESQARNFERWPVLGEWLWPNDFVGQTFQQEVNYLKSWVADRMLWLDREWIHYVLDAEKNIESNFSVYPNPSRTGWKLEYNNATAKEVSFQLLNSQGVVVKTLSTRGTNGAFNEFLADHSLTDGLYIIKMTVNGSVVATKKVVKGDLR